MSTRDQFEAQFNAAVAQQQAQSRADSAAFNRTAATAGGAVLVLNLAVLGAIGAIGYVIWRAVKK